MNVIHTDLYAKKKKRTFIASMHNYNPYRIGLIPESLYKKIMNSREVTILPQPISPKNHKTVFLPPVKTEEISTKMIRKSIQQLFDNGKEQNPQGNDIKVDSIQVLSKSLDFHDIELKDIKPNQKKRTSTKLRERIRNNQKNHEQRTMSAMHQRQKSFKIPMKFKEDQSPWAFQAEKYFKVQLNN